MSNFFYPLVENPYSNEDIKKGIDVLKSKQLTISSKTNLFEKKFSMKLKTKYSLMVNSGSSANLMALQCLINPYRKKRLSKGDEVFIRKSERQAKLIFMENNYFFQNLSSRLSWFRSEE